MDGDNNGRYNLGLFLRGAYEEAQGGLHDLFGGPSVVRLESQPDGPHGFVMTCALPGPTCADLLRTMRHEPRLMVEAFKRRAEELGVDGGEQDGVATGAMAGGLAGFFDSWPYLIATSTLGMRADSGNGFY